MIRLIAAVSKNGIIGITDDTGKQKLPWEGKYPEDMKFFRQATAGGTVLMGRKTFQSIGRPLPKRRNIVITSSKDPIEGVEIANRFEDAIDMASTPIPAVGHLDLTGKIIPPEDKDNIWIIGGASIYERGLQIADEIILNIIPEIIEGNGLVRFPWINALEFSIKDVHSLGDSEIMNITYIRNN